MPTESVSPAGDRRVLGVMGTSVELLLTSDETNGTITLARVSVPPGVEVGPHIHTREDEHFYVLEGGIELTVAGVAQQLIAGVAATAPRHIVHAFRNPTDRPASILVSATPGGLEGFFRDASEIPASGETTEAVFERYGLVFA